MKKRWKVFWAVCGVAAGVGVICCASAFALGVTEESIRGRFPYGIIRHYNSVIYLDDWDLLDDWDIVDHVGNSDSFVEDMYKSYSGIQNVSIEVSGAIVNLEPTQGDEVEVETNGIPKKLKLQCRQDGGELEIISGKKRVQPDSGSITVRIPVQQELGSVEVSLKAGSLYIEEIRSQELSVAVGAGEADVVSFESQEADFECGAGSLRVSGMARDEVNVECGVGEIIYTAADRMENYDYEISCGAGEVVLDESTYSGIGYVQELNYNTGREFNINCGMGSIEVGFDKDL